MTWENFSKKPGIVPCVRDASGLVVALGVGYSDEELQKLCVNYSAINNRASCFNHQCFVTYKCNQVL